MFSFTEKKVCLLLLLWWILSEIKPPFKASFLKTEKNEKYFLLLQSFDPAGFSIFCSRGATVPMPISQSTAKSGKSSRILLTLWFSPVCLHFSSLCFHFPDCEQAQESSHQSLLGISFLLRRNLGRIIRWIATQLITSNRFYIQACSIYFLIKQICSIYRSRK